MLNFHSKNTEWYTSELEHIDGQFGKFESQDDAACLDHVVSEISMSLPEAALLPVIDHKHF